MTLAMKYLSNLVPATVQGLCLAKVWSLPSESEEVVDTHKVRKTGGIAVQHFLRYAFPDQFLGTDIRPTINHRGIQAQTWNSALVSTMPAVTGGYHDRAGFDF